MSQATITAHARGGEFKFILALAVDMESRCKFWCFTSFNINDVPLRAFTDKYDYLVYGKEKSPTTNRFHWQGFVAFKVRTKLSTLSRWIPGGHFEKMRGTPEEASDYCKKDGDFSEFGVLPTIVKSSDVFKECISRAENGLLTSVKRDFPGVYLRYKSTLHSLRTFTVDELENSCGIWICGPPRCGKDYAVRQLKDVYMKPLSKWWDGYKNEKYVLISDVEPNHCTWLGYFLKIWSDRYAFNAEIKGSSMMIRPKNIFVTSNFSLEDCLQGNILSAVKARFNVYKFDDVNGYTLEPRDKSVINTRVLRTLQLNEPELGIQLEDEHVPSTLSLEEAAVSSVSPSPLPQTTWSDVWSEEDFA